ncbi:MAG: DNA-binding response regulator [Caldilinea sp. CFX5]|nr:DNA-binding response regulator [Caldilinea sp. CFX5]
MHHKIKVAILDDHQSIIDGYCHRLSHLPEIEIVATATYGAELATILARQPVDVLLLDVGVPISADDPNPYPILHTIPHFLQQYPALHVLVISMHNRHTLIKAVMEAGASGYILKDDRETIQHLGAVINTIANGGVHFSQQAYQQFKKQDDTTTLTPRQLEALSLCAAYPDASTAELAQRLAVAHSTLRNLLSGAYTKLAVRTRTAAIVRARQLGLITPLE